MIRTGVLMTRYAVRVLKYSLLLGLMGLMALIVVSSRLSWSSYISDAQHQPELGTGTMVFQDLDEPVVSARVKLLIPYLGLLRDPWVVTAVLTFVVGLLLLDWSMSLMASHTDLLQPRPSRSRGGRHAATRSKPGGRHALARFDGTQGYCRPMPRGDEDRYYGRHAADSIWRRTRGRAVSPMPRLQFA